VMTPKKKYQRYRRSDIQYRVQSENVQLDPDISQGKTK